MIITPENEYAGSNSNACNKDPFLIYFFKYIFTVVTVHYFLLICFSIFSFRHCLTKKLPPNISSSMEKTTKTYFFSHVFYKHENKFLVRYLQSNHDYKVETFNNSYHKINKLHFKCQFYN